MSGMRNFLREQARQLTNRDIVTNTRALVADVRARVVDAKARVTDRNVVLSVQEYEKETEKPNIIFPLLIKPLNDKNSSLHPNRYWRGKAGANSATFGSSRSGGRRHAGRDLYGKELTTSIVAICDGVVLGRNAFFNQTDEVVILHTTNDGRKFIIRYAEVAPSSVAVRRGDNVIQGQEIAKIGALTPSITIDGRTTNMLHIEYYTGSEGFNLSKPLTDRNSSSEYRRRADVADPLDILIEGYANTFNVK